MKICNYAPLTPLKTNLSRFFEGCIWACLAIGVIALLVGLPPLLFTGNDYVISEKTLKWPPYESDYFIVATLPSGFGEVAAYPRAFYDKAQVGDHLHGKVNGYVSLVRDGHVLARHAGEDLVFVSGFAIASAVPLLALLKIKNKALLILVRTVATLSALVVAYVLWIIVSIMFFGWD